MDEGDELGKRLCLQKVSCKQGLSFVMIIKINLKINCFGSCLLMSSFATLRCDYNDFLPKNNDEKTRVERMTGKEFVILLIVLLSGLLFGSLLGQILGPWIPFLRESKMLTWSPAADLDILKYNLHFEVKLNLASIGGLVLAFWIYKKIR
ncbi:DUF4321 domain-containing protein [Brevibacillus laterosporus]|uniref:DUF4321 domain-containing protein n=1 Tax=Brevibacillus laterosporus TaxID=1465 RepID=UPI0024073412|nr:DUF4321 domain-containing protein [Brevibacillus laterosporus]